MIKFKINTYILRLWKSIINIIISIEEGEQIYNFFGNKHNGFLFLWYGFCFEDNIYDKIFFIIENNSVIDYSVYEFPP